MATESSKAEILARIAATRDELSVSVSGVGKSLDFRTRLQTEMGRHPVVWVAGAIGVGVVLSLAFTRRRRGNSEREGILAGSAIRWVGSRLLPLLLPYAKKWIETEMTALIARRKASPRTAAGYRASDRSRFSES